MPAAKSGNANPKSKPKVDLLESAFALIASQGWRRFSFRRLAEQANVPLIEVYRVLGSEQALLDRLVTRIDEAMIEMDQKELTDLPVRDRVFELMMRRFDALAAFRLGLIRMAREGSGDPWLLLSAACRLDRSMGWLQEAAGLRRRGIRALLQRRALMAVYGAAARVWLNDKDADQAKTMASLDRLLRAIESCAGLGGGGSLPAADALEPA